MKKIYFILFLLPLLLCSCKSNEQKAKDALTGYALNIANYNLDDAEQYATSETIETTIDTYRNLLQYVDSAYLEQDSPASIVIDLMSITSDTTAEGTYTKTTPIKHEQYTVQLRKRNGKWMVHNPMETKKVDPEDLQQAPAQN